MNEDVADSEAEILTAKQDIEALNLKSQVIQRQQKKARAANDRGLKHLRVWEVAEAVQAFRTAAEADPADIEVNNSLGHAYLWQDDLPPAEASLLWALTMVPGRLYAWVDLGHVYAPNFRLRRHLLLVGEYRREMGQRFRTRQAITSLPTAA